MPEPEKLERDPPETEISDSTKLVEASEREKEREAVSPALSEEVSEVRAMVGGVVSAATVLMASVSELLASEPSRLLLPAASENLELATEMTPSVVLSAVGVKVAE